MARYFAYGSNMSAQQMATRCPGARCLGITCAAGWRLAFDRPSAKWGGHVADLLPSAGGQAWGVLWDVTDDHLAALDLHERVAAGAYRRASVRVSSGARTVDCIAYLVVSPGPESLPSQAYLDVILEGAREHGLPAWYIAKLEEIAGANPAD